MNQRLDFFNGEEPLPFLTAPKQESCPIHLRRPPIHYTVNSSYSGTDKAKAEGENRLALKRRDAPSLDLVPDLKKQALLNEFEVCINTGNKLFIQQDYAKAMMYYEQVLHSDPYHLAALDRKSTCLWKLGSLKNGIDCLTLILQCYPTHAPTWAKRGAVFIQQHKYPEALADLKKSVALNSSRIFLEFVLLLHCYYSFQKVQDTASFYLNYPSRDSQGRQLVSEDDLCLLRGIFFASQQDYRSALQELSKAAQTPTHYFAQIILETVKGTPLCKAHLDLQSKSVSLKTGVIPISVLLTDESKPPV